MKKNLLNRPMLAILLAAGVVSIAEGQARPQAVSNRSLEVRFVPLVRGGQLRGLKAYAIHADSRYAQAGLANGDTVEAIDGAPITRSSDAEKITDARTDVEVRVARSGTRQIVTLTIPRA